MRQAAFIILCVPFIFVGLACTETEDEQEDEFEVWQDSFEDTELGDSWTPGVFSGSPSPRWEIENGILKGFWPYWNAQFLFLEEYPSLDYTIEVKCRIDKVWQSASLAGVGIVFRASGSGVDPNVNIVPIYGFGIYTSCAQFMIVRGVGNWSPAAAFQEKHDIGQWYTLKLLVRGDDFLGYVDDKPVCRLNNSESKGKFVGVSIGANVDGSFDDFMITDAVDDEAFSKFDASL